MKYSDEQLLEDLKNELDSDLEKIDNATMARLAFSRREALSERSVRGPLLVPLAPAYAFVATAVVFTILLRVPGLPSDEMDMNMNALLIDFTLAAGEMELVDELDFVRWLEASGNAASGNAG